MYKKLLTAAAVSLALTGCASDNDGNGNFKSSVTLLGTVSIGETLSASVSDENGIQSAAITYNWLADGEALITADTTSSRYVILPADAGAEISVNVEFIDDAGFNEDATSSKTIAVPALTDNVDGSIVLSGTAKVGSQLSVSIADDNGFEESAVTYVWLADGTAISSASSNTYLLTDNEVAKVITVTASYTDNSGFEEALTSNASAKVAAEDDSAGSASISGDLLEGDTLTVVIDDPDGASTAPTAVQWYADEIAISDAQEATYVASADDLGKTLSVELTYTDDMGYSSELVAQADDRIYSVIVNNGDELIAAAEAVSEGQWIALADASGGDYTNLSNIVSITKDYVTFTTTQDSTAVISGTACFALEGDGITVDGLVFNDVTPDATVRADSGYPGKDCTSNGSGVVSLQGDGITVKNSTFAGFIASGSEEAILAIKGESNLVERNSFSGWDPTIDKTGAITMYANDSGSYVNNVVQYNVFKDTLSDPATRVSGAFAIQIGRSTGDDSTGVTEHAFQYNLIDGVQQDERLIKVQASGVSIKGNTIVNHTGQISYEDGAFGTISENIIMSASDDSDDGGIAFSVMGHTITNNYIANIRTTSGDRAAIYIHDDMYESSGNAALIAAAQAAGSDELKTELSYNTVHNAKQPIQFDDHGECADYDYDLTVNNNLIANESDNSNGKDTSKSAQMASAWNATCDLSLSSAPAQSNHFYDDVITDDSSVNFATLEGGIDGASLTTPDLNGMVEGTGTDANVGVALDDLTYITEDMVGPHSTWMAQ